MQAVRLQDHGVPVLLLFMEAQAEMILGVEVQEDPLERISNIIGLGIGMAVWELILHSILEAVKPMKKKQMEERIIFLESRITTKYLELKDEVIIP